MRWATPFLMPPRAGTDQFEMFFFRISDVYLPTTTPTILTSTLQLLFLYGKNPSLENEIKSTWKRCHAISCPGHNSVLIWVKSPARSRHTESNLLPTSTSIYFNLKGNWKHVECYIPDGNRQEFQISTKRTMFQKLVLVHLKSILTHFYTQKLNVIIHGCC